MQHLGGARESPHQLQTHHPYRCARHTSACLLHAENAPALWSTWGCPAETEIGAKEQPRSEQNASGAGHSPQVLPACAWRRGHPCNASPRWGRAAAALHQPPATAAEPAASGTRAARGKGDCCLPNAAGEPSRRTPQLSPSAAASEPEKAQGRLSPTPPAAFPCPRSPPAGASKGMDQKHSVLPIQVVWFGYLQRARSIPKGSHRRNRGEGAAPASSAPT